MPRFKRLSFVTRSILTTTAIILLVSATLIISSLTIQKNILTTEMEKQSTDIAARWGETLDPSLVEKAAEETAFDAEAQSELTAIFDEISANNPNIAQAYLFESELVEGSKSAIIANPTHIVEMLKEADLRIGDLNEHPPASAKAIQKLNETNEITASSIYNDQFGTWITAMYPIKNSAGETFAFFGVDVDASMVKNGIHKFLLSSLIFLIQSF